MPGRRGWGGRCRRRRALGRLPLWRQSAICTSPSRLLAGNRIEIPRHLLRHDVRAIDGAGRSQRLGKSTALPGWVGAGDAGAFMGRPAASAARGVRALPRPGGLRLSGLHPCPTLTVRRTDLRHPGRPAPRTRHGNLVGRDWSRAPTRSRPRSGGEQQRRRPDGSSTAVHRSSSPTIPPADTRSAAFVLAELRRLADDGAVPSSRHARLGAAALAESVLIMRDGRSSTAAAAPPPTSCWSDGAAA